MIDKALSEELLLFMERYLSFYHEFLLLETTKYNDMASNNIQALNDHVNNEEAYMLKSKGLELERDKLVAKTGLPKATFRELIPLFEEPEQNKMKTIYNDLHDVLSDLKETNLRCNYLTELRLRRVEIDLQKLEKRPDLQKLYNARARDSSKSASILSKKI